MNPEGENTQQSSPEPTAARIDNAAADSAAVTELTFRQRIVSRLGLVLDYRREVAAAILVLMMLGMLFDSAPTPAPPADSAVEFESIDDLFAELDASVSSDGQSEEPPQKPQAAVSQDEQLNLHRNASWSPEAPVPPLAVPAQSPTQTQQTPLSIPGANAPSAGTESANPSPPIRFSGEIRFGN